MKARRGFSAFKSPSAGLPERAGVFCALTRRCVVSIHRIVNCTPARCCVWPVLAPAGAWVRAGGWRQGDAILLKCLAFDHACSAFLLECLAFDHACSAFLLECLAFVSRLLCASVGMFCVLFTPALRFCWNVLRSLHACSAFLLECLAFDHACLFSFVRKRETACGRLRFYSARVGIAIRAFSKAVRLSDLFGSLRACAFLYGDLDGVRRDAENGVGGAAQCVFA